MNISYVNSNKTTSLPVELDALNNKDISYAKDFFLYIETQLKIAKDFFDLPAQKVQDAWGYPSIKNKKNLNIVFRPGIAKKLLELKGGILCRLGKDKNIIVKAVTHGFDMNGLPIYYLLGSSIHKDYFPEVQCDYENSSVKKT